MHIYNWYHPNITGIHYIHKHSLQYTWRIPLAFSPCWLPFAPLSNPLYLLGTLLAVTGSVHLGLRLFVNWPPLSQPFPRSLPPPNSQNPSYQASTRLTKTTLRIRHLLSGTLQMNIPQHAGNFITHTNHENGPSCNLRPKRLRQHLGPDFSQLLTLKKTSRVLQVFLKKKVLDSWNKMNCFDGTA